MSVSLEHISDVLLPRRYQEEIFVRAQQGNVIAALDTGSGKTYISTLLIKWVVAQNVGKERIVVFLVPKVALVQQQGEFIAKQTSLRVRQFSGATAHEMGDRTGWKKEFDDSDVFVMTGMFALETCCEEETSFASLWPNNDSDAFERISRLLWTEWERSSYRLGCSFSVFPLQLKFS